MSKRFDPKEVLLYLADSLDVQGTLATFPELTGDGLSELLREAAASMAPEPVRAVLHVDGGARGNPGPAGYGFVISSGDGPLVQRGGYVGQATNNVAEYSALVAGLEAAAELGIREVEVMADSELMVRQMTGQYRVKNEGLKPLYAKAQAAAARIGKVSYQHIPREKNKEADKLANMAIDAKGSVSL
jgi:ribonuclease HI